MYTKYFGFNEKPFTLTPNPRFIFLSKNHKEAFAHLLYGINSHYGFIELIGEVGTGKTTVLRTLLNQLQEENYRTALIVNPCLTGVELLRSICHEFGLSSDSEYANELLVEINKFLLQETAEGRTVVLIIDESQNLQPAVLEQIRLISNLETEDDKLIQIILAGQPELASLLERPELRQLNQRIAVRYRLKSMSMLETRSYIRHRMEVAGESSGVSFSLFATRWVYLYTRGVPRMINILCDRCLLIAYGDEKRRVTASIVTRAIRELLNEPQNKRFSLVVTLTVICALILAFLLYAKLPIMIQGYMKTASDSQANANATTERNSDKAPKSIQSSGTVAADKQFSKLQKEILSYDQNAVHLHAFNAIAGKWGVLPIKSLNGPFTIPDRYSRLAAIRELRITTYNGSLDDVIRFDLPFLVLTKVTGSHYGYCIAVTSVNNDSATISPTLFGSSSISKSDIKSIATGTFYLVWQNFNKIPDKIKRGDTLYEIRALQILLQQAGTYKEGINGNYSAATAKAVADFQQLAGIPHNENVGELTLAALSKYSNNRKVPSISNGKTN